MKRLIFFLLLWSLSFSALCEDVELSGFGSLGFVSSDSDVYGYRNDISQITGTFKGDLGFETTSILGLQMDVRANDKFDLIFQAVYRDQNNFNLNTAFSQAFARYQSSINWSFRLGRTPFDLFGFTEYRDIGFSYLWTKVPNEVYGIVPNRFLDGVDATFQTQFNNLTFRSKVFTGKSSTEVSSIDQVEEIKLKEATGFTLELESDRWSLKANYTKAVIGNNISRIEDILQGIAFIGLAVPNAWPDSQLFAADFSLAQKKASYASMSGRYRSERWAIVGELSSIKGDGTLIRPLNNGFVTFSYHFDELSLFSGFARSKAKRFNFIAPFDPVTVFSDPALIGFAQQLFFGIGISGNFFASNQATTMLGVRWDIDDSVALKLQWDKTTIDERGGTLWVVEDLTFSDREVVNALHLNLSFIF